MEGGADAQAQKALVRNNRTGEAGGWGLAGGEGQVAGGILRAGVSGKAACWVQRGEIGIPDVPQPQGGVLGTEGRGD